jgi:hypothetical protein
MLVRSRRSLLTQPTEVVFMGLIFSTRLLECMLPEERHNKRVDWSVNRVMTWLHEFRWNDVLPLYSNIGHMFLIFYFVRDKILANNYSFHTLFVWYKYKLNHKLVLLDSECNHTNFVSKIYVGHRLVLAKQSKIHRRTLNLAPGVIQISKLSKCTLRFLNSLIVSREV